MLNFVNYEDLYVQIETCGVLLTFRRLFVNAVRPKQMKLLLIVHLLKYSVFRDELNM
jgi:hypothetical protein